MSSLKQNLKEAKESQQMSNDRKMEGKEDMEEKGKSTSNLKSSTAITIERVIGLSKILDEYDKNHVIFKKNRAGKSKKIV